MAALKLAHVLNVLQFVLDKRMVGVALAVDEAENLASFLPAIVASQPARGLGKRHHEEEEQEGRDHLETPGDAPVGSGVVGDVVASDEGAAVRNVVHDENTPSNRPLLEANEATTFGRGRNLSNVDSNLSRLDTDTDTIDDATDDEHANVLSSTAEDRTDDPAQLVSNRLTLPNFIVASLPDDAAEHNRLLATKAIRERTRNQSTNPGTTSHCGDDTTLDESTRTSAAVFIGNALVEIAAVRLFTQLGGHGRNVKAKEGAANDGDAGNHVDVADSHVGHLNQALLAQQQRNQVQQSVAGRGRGGEETKAAILWRGCLIYVQDLLVGVAERGKGRKDKAGKADGPADSARPCLPFSEAT